MKRTDTVQRRRKRDQFLRQANAATVALIAASTAAMDDEDEDDDDEEEIDAQVKPDEETPEESPKPEGEAKVENPDEPAKPESGDEGEKPVIKTEGEEDCDEDDEEIDAKCKVTAEQVEQAAIMAFNPYHDRGGRFTSKDGAELGDEEANAARDVASAIGKAAKVGAASNRSAADAYERAASVAGNVAERSKREFDAALQRGDKLASSAHMTEFTRATQNVATFQKMRMEHEEADRRGGNGYRESGNASQGGASGSGGSMAGSLGRAALGATRLALRVTGKTATAIGVGTALGSAAATFGTGGATLGITGPTGAAGLALAMVGRGISRLGKSPEAPKPTPPPKATPIRDAITRGIAKGAGKAAARMTDVGSEAAGRLIVDRVAQRLAERKEERTPKSPFASGSTPYYKATVVPEAGVAKPGVKWEPFSSSVGTWGSATSSSTVGGYAPSERTFRRAAASKRVDAGEMIGLAILAKQSQSLAPIHATETSPSYPDIVATHGSIQIQAAEPSAGRVPRFNIAPAYNGGPLKVESYDLPIIVDLAGMEVNKQSVQAVLFHDPKRLVGHVDNVRNNGRTLELAGPCSGLRSQVDEFVDSATNPGKRFPWKASIEARPLEKPTLVRKGERVTVNGRMFEGPVLVARKTELYGVSFVPRGADSATVVSIAAQAALSRNHHHPKEKTPMEPSLTFEAWLDAVYPKPIQAKMDDSDKAEARKVYDDQMAAIHAHFNPEPEPSAPEWDVDDIRATFDVKGDEFESLYAKYETDENLPKGKFSEVKATAKKSMRDLRAKAIEHKWDKALYAAECDKIQASAELSLVRESRPRGPGIHAPKSDPSITNDVLAAAVLQAGRYSLRSTETAADGTSVVKNIEAAETLYPDQVLQTAHTQFKRGIGLQELIVAAAEINGWHGRSFKQAPQECLRYAFGQAPIHATSFSTADMSGILSNVANKFLLQGFFFVEQAWQQISARRSVNDFKTTTAYRLTRGGGFSLVPASGELKHGTIGEESYTNKADTYGEMLAITRTDIINDDLGAITTVPRSLGRDAGLSMNDVFWTEFLGQISTLFTAARLNKLTYTIDTASAALGIDSLTLAEKKFMELKDSSGKPIGHMPTILLTSPALGVTAAKLYNDTEIRVPSSSTKTADYTTGNPHAGKFRPVVSRYIGNSSFSGYTSTGWGILADPQDVPIMEMVFLYGVEAPTIEQADADFNTLGIQMRAYLDFGCNAQDYRGGVWSDGSTS